MACLAWAAGDVADVYDIDFWVGSRMLDFKVGVIRHNFSALDLETTDVVGKLVDLKLE